MKLRFLTTSANSRWIFPLLLVFLLGGFLSMRLLSDPDLGFHLKYGQWITQHHAVPEKDLSTYTVPNNDYTDIHWLFQVLIYNSYAVTGYRGLSILVCVLTMFLLLLLTIRMQWLKRTPWLICLGLFMALIIIEPSIGPHPELLTFIFLTLTLLITDLYYHQKKNYLFLLPVIQLLWCNMHGLFILGFITSGTYLFSLWRRDRHIDRNFTLWFGLSVVICLVNPYFIKGFMFPFELVTRFNPNNIYNKHIQEFMPFFRQQHFVLRDYLFLLMLFTVYFLIVQTHRSRTLHELLLVPLFSLLALLSIRNIPLFVIVALPVCIKVAGELKINPGKKFENILLAFLLVIPISLIPRVVTDVWYLKNKSFNKTGIGLDSLRQPTGAAKFMMRHKLDGRIINSIGFGGWLSWELKQPVFIDGRLEVMREELYTEVFNSWYNGLPLLVSKYHPDLIAYNYLVYYPWTLQLASMPDWRLLYIDETAALYARAGYATSLPGIKISSLPSYEEELTPVQLISWIEGFYKRVDYLKIAEQHKAFFRFQEESVVRHTGNSEAIRCYNSGNEKYRKGNIRGAISDLTNAIELNPEYTKALNNRAIIYAMEVKDYTAAFADFNKALLIDPGYSEAWLGRGTAFFLQQRQDSACENWRRASLLGNAQAQRLIGLHCNTK